MCTSLIRLSVREQLGGFHTLAPVKNTAGNCECWYCLRVMISVLLNKFLPVGLPDRTVVSFNFLRPLHAVFHSSDAVSPSLQPQARVPVPLPPCQYSRCYLIVVGFALPWWLVTLSIFHIPVGRLYVFYGNATFLKLKKKGWGGGPTEKSACIWKGPMFLYLKYSIIFL